jgi:hypothetical protein
MGELPSATFAADRRRRKQAHRRTMPALSQRAGDRANGGIERLVEGNSTIVLETGLYNLTNDEVPVLVHTGPDTREQRTLIRLKPPEEQAPAPTLP